MANSILAQIAGFGDSYWVNTEVVASGQPGADYPVQSKGIAAAITAATPDASATAKGLVKQAANVAASEATDVAGCVTSINAILTALKTAGVMVADEE